MCVCDDNFQMFKRTATKILENTYIVDVGKIYFVYLPPLNLQC